MSTNPSPATSLLSSFRQPPPGYGEVSFYWWLGDPLTRERLSWQLERLSGHAISGLQINYAHSDRGGLSWGLTYPSEPPLFSEPWWELFGWFLDEANKRGMAVSLSDYTLGPGQQSAIDNAIAAYPQVKASVLRHEVRELSAGQQLDWQMPESLLSVVQVTEKGLIDLRSELVSGRLALTATTGMRLAAVWTEPRSPSIDPTHPESGRAVAEHFFGPFDRRFPGRCGTGLNYFFSDELEFGYRGKVWSDRLREAFQRAKGYDITPELPGLFIDAGPRTPKLRMDYNDVFVSLSERHYFQPVYHWHESRGMTYGCDHGGRGQDVTEFGDYFRTQRWNQGVGCDQPRLEVNLIKNKVASSIAHLYRRPRVWLEGFYSSGWGTSTAQLWNAVAANFLQGHNLLTLHGLYYSTHGGWWEWAPPCNHFRMPYWAGGHMKPFLAATERLSYLLSQGTHVADIAILYPVASGEANLNARESVGVAFDLAHHLYAAGHDFDFADFESIDHGSIRDGRLQMADESFSVLILPAMRAIRHSTLCKARDFARSGGVVIAVAPLPEATDRTGFNDPEVLQIVHELFGPGGLAYTARSVAEAIDQVRARVPAPIVVHNGPVPRAFVRRRVGEHTLVGLHGLPANAEITVALTGEAVRLDPLTGLSTPLTASSSTVTHTTFALRNHPDELQLILVSARAPKAGPIAASPHHKTIPLPGDWDIDYLPTLDNTFGDFAWPPSGRTLGPEARSFKYAPASTGLDQVACEKDFDDTGWAAAHAGFGPYFLHLGPRSARVPQEAALTPDRSWIPYEFSFERGLRDDPGHQGYHGLKEEVHDAFIAFGNLVHTHPATRREPHPAGDVNYLCTWVHAAREQQVTLAADGLAPAAAYLNGQPVVPGAVTLRTGANRLVLCYDKPGTGYAVLLAPGASLPSQRTTVGSLRSPWAGHDGVMTFDTRPDEARPAGWYRFTAPPGVRSLTVPTSQPARAWADGVELQAVTKDGSTTFNLPAPANAGCTIALRLEHRRGEYGGAAIPGPITFECGPATLPTGDWTHLPGLHYYSGGMRYRRSFSFTDMTDPGTVHAILDLGEVVSSAEVVLNGKPVGMRFAPPWTFDISGALRAGANELSITVYSTLAAHYRSIPTDYPGTEQRSGLLGPVAICYGH